MMEVLYLSSDEVIDLATPAEYVVSVREGFRQHGDGCPALMPMALRHGTDETAGITTYTTILPDTGVMGGYVYSYNLGADEFWFLTPLFDYPSAAPIAILDGASMNPFKTGAAGAVSVDVLSRPESSTLAVVGSGIQAFGQALATVTVRDVSDVRIYSPTPSNRTALADDLGRVLDGSVTVRAVDAVTTAIRDADVIVTATRSSSPVFDAADVPDGAHISAIGGPNTRELDEATIARSRYVPDLIDRALHESESLIAALESGVIDDDHIYAELGQVVAGHVPGRETADEVTVFDSSGTGIETVASAAMLYERAVERGRGTPVSVAPASDTFERLRDRA